jgi:hypothetical protein
LADDVPDRVPGQDGSAGELGAGAFGHVVKPWLLFAASRPAVNDVR